MKSVANLFSLILLLLIPFVFYVIGVVDNRIEMVDKRFEEFWKIHLDKRITEDQS